MSYPTWLLHCKTSAGNAQGDQSAHNGELQLNTKGTDTTPQLNNVRAGWTAPDTATFVQLSALMRSVYAGGAIDIWTPPPPPPVPGGPLNTFLTCWVFPDYTNVDPVTGKPAIKYSTASANNSAEGLPVGWDKVFTILRWKNGVCIPWVAIHKPGLDPDEIWDDVSAVWEFEMVPGGTT